MKNYSDIIKLWNKTPSKVNWKKLNEEVEKKAIKMLKELEEKGTIKYTAPYPKNII